MFNPDISIIIPTFNAGDHIARCLKSIQAQGVSCEIIVVDQESDDNTVAIAEENGAHVVSLSKPQFYSPPSHSRNVGAQLASGRFLYHLDADMELSQGLLAEIIDLFDTIDYVALIVHELDKPTGFWGESKAFERRLYWGHDVIESARVVRHEIFEKVGKYDENVSSGEDFSIHRKYKNIGKIGFCTNVVFHHPGKLDFIKLIRKKFNYGKTGTLVKSEISGVKILIEEFIIFVKSYKEFIKHPLLGIGCLILKGSEFAAGGLGYFIKR